jgi:hypothetical protein
LDNTLRFTLLFDFTKGGKKSTENNSGISLVPDEPSQKKAKKEKNPEPQPTPAPQTKPGDIPPTEPK